jgi:DNA-binding NtrC family response regulator
VASLEDMERRHIRDVLARTGGNRSKTAALLGIASSTLYEKMRKYGIG